MEPNKQTNETKTNGNGGAPVGLRGGKQEIDPGMYVITQGGIEVGHVVVISTGSTTTLEHYFLYTASGTAKAPYTFPRQGAGTVAVGYAANGADPGTAFNAATFRAGLGIQNHYFVHSTTDNGIA